MTGDHHQRRPDRLAVRRASRNRHARSSNRGLPRRRSILGDPSAITTGWQLDYAEPLLLANGFSSITIGSATAGLVDINSATLPIHQTSLVMIDGGDDLIAGANAVLPTATTIFTQVEMRSVPM